MVGKDDESERRVELVAQVKVLDERTHHINKAVDRIEKALVDHVQEEEMAFHNFYKTKAEMWEQLDQFKDDIFKKIESTVKPVSENFTQLKTIYKVIAAIASLLFVIGNYFVGEIKGEYKKHIVEVENIQKQTNMIEDDVSRLSQKVTNLHKNEK